MERECAFVPPLLPHMSRAPDELQSLVARCQLGQEQITYTLKQACRLPVLSVDERRLLFVLLNVTN